MLFRSSLITHTKKLFKRSLESFKYLLSNGYTKLPKSPPCHCTFNPFSCTRLRLSDTKLGHNYRALDSFYADHTNNQSHAANKETVTTDKSRNNIVITKSPRPKNQDLIVSKNVALFPDQKNRSKRKGKGNDQQKKIRMSLVSEKLREMEKMDGGNMEHVLDIEQVIHYYSRITCPTYRRIVDKFFAELYAEFSTIKARVGAASGGNINVAKRREQRISLGNIEN